MTTPRVRFAPSPTGFLHIGGVRAALYNYLYARGRGGQFLLRIEDTDLERSEKRFTDDILASMKWLGLTWDEEPIFQSERLQVYRDKAEELVAKGLAYRCVCTEKDVEAMREAAMAAGKKPQYDRRCRTRKDIAPTTTHVIRAAIPLEGSVEFLDLVRGTITVQNSEIDDFVIIRSNGAPTYNLSVVVDDVYSRMTHIIRGDDHINNTPKQLHLYRALNYPVPAFAHLPMIMGPDKKKLSKRHGAVSVNAYREEGYLPEALLNFLARCGWSHGDQEIFTLEEMIKHFSFDHVQKSSAVFNIEKLQWTNGTHIRAASAERLQGIVTGDYAATLGPGLERAHSPLGAKLVALISPKVKFVREIADQLAPLCAEMAPELAPGDVAALKWNKDPALKTATQTAVRELLTAWDSALAAKGSVARTGADSAWGTAPSLTDLGWDHTRVDAELRAAGERNGVKLGDLAQPLRLSVSGKPVSASLFDLLALLPWDVLKPRMERVLSL